MNELTLKNYFILTPQTEYVPTAKLIPLTDPVTFDSLRVNTGSKVSWVGIGQHTRTYVPARFR